MLVWGICRIERGDKKKGLHGQCGLMVTMTAVSMSSRSSSGSGREGDPDDDMRGRLDGVLITEHWKDKEHLENGISPRGVIRRRH